MGRSCCVYGLGVQVNVPIAGLSGLRARLPVDVHMSLGSMPLFVDAMSADEWGDYYVGPELGEDGESAVRVWRTSDEGYFRIGYPDGTDIVVDVLGTRVWATWPDSATVEDTATYLLGPTLGFVLRLRGTTCLHASAIAIGDKAIAFVGPSGHGKSTIAAAFARLGYPVLTDDVLALLEEGEVFMAQPAYPRVRLWPSSVEGLYGAADALPRITPGWDKRFLDLTGQHLHFQHEPLPLAGIYFLDDRSIDPAAGCRIEPVTAREGVMSLVANTYVSYLLDRPMRANEFKVLGRLAEQIPLRRVTPCAGFDKVPELCNAIAEDFRQLAACEVE